MKHLVFAGVVALAPFSAIADTYKCEVKPDTGHEDWLIPSVTFIEHDKATGEVVVFDGLIKEIYGQPIEARISTDNAKRTTYSWNVSGLKVGTTEGGTAMMQNIVYKFTIVKANLQARTSVKPLGFLNTFRGKGKCSIV
ncbi:hypothetical protein K3X41_04950 [Aliiroseovarius crassostreae]|uniref:Uncharacterized protein n=1 Tax=Aliiroseovarius crassostreae TaxID=154981 RepID=A0A0P7KJC6_9RHOB|nr:hypothetical protein [Aliiroseovarius crassostreae]KPN62033.1 hypothetical protein AKJ29_05385 [Aliiroseovarius crassostreae]UWP90022.1 hypothetical protein K3J57_04885 [Aliiroseovarius crassostreae]UWP93181.1 hypothetical protein K3X13_04915 [Aliiroseovarius crassostreae]UWP96319.1 hypothetical protein K3X48_04850 [Aliiroseovarius crassostreae]UWP99484.1 hypothetical protein K3X53_04905 [Aliiroseovarius crassostreae]